MKVPIACTLSAESAADRVEEWRRALGPTVSAVHRPATTRAELRLVGGPASIAALVDLARREKVCCGFFGFSFEVDEDGVVLAVSVPDDAVEVLDGFATLATSTQSPEGERHW
jgi:hypothetical protein